MTKANAQQDFEAALHEIESNLDVRRLMVVVMNILVPATTMAAADALTGATPPPAMAWLPANILWIVGTVLAVGGVWTSAILSRCHFGLVVNGTKMSKVRHGKLSLHGLNWLGVTTNFLGITALSSGAGAALCFAVFGMPWLGLGAGLTLAVALMVLLRIKHTSAQSLCRRLDANWQQGEVPHELLELHARKSLDSTSADVAVIVAMGAALFAGTFQATCNLGNVAQSATPHLERDSLMVTGSAGLMFFTLASLLLTSRIVVRLRIALAVHATRLAELRSETDNPWRFSLWERTFLLYLVVALLASTAALMGTWAAAGGLAGGIAGVVVFVAHLIWYPVQLGMAAKRRD